MCPLMYNVLSQDTFYRFDSDRSGNIDARELQQTLTAFGYNLSPQAIGAIVRHFATDGKIVFDSFVACCVRLRVLTSECCVQYKWKYHLSEMEGVHL